MNQQPQPTAAAVPWEAIVGSDWKLFEGILRLQTPEQQKIAERHSPGE